MYYRTFLEWFFIVFLQSIYGHVSIDKKRKKIATIINAKNSSSDFYFGHFVGAEDIPQSCMLFFSSQYQILGFLK